MNFRLVPFGAGLEKDFFRFHCPANEAGWCFCVAWWVESWDGWGERTAEQNRQFRESLFAGGQYDGYLLYDDSEPEGGPIAWCQVGERDRLVKLVNQMALLPDSESWAITCFLVAPDYRRQGVAQNMLALILADLRRNGIHYIEAYPKRGTNLDTLDMWNGPESMYLSAGFEFVKEVGQRAVYRLALKR